MTLNSLAERKADSTRNLAEFNNLSLPGVREQVSEMLRMIGNEGIFSTYTKHDISHIDEMLEMLEWVIPECTANKMTPADWLLVVLSIYLHDLGLLVTSEEYQNRNENEEFCLWFKGLDYTSEGREYLIARTHRMNQDEKDRFFFQEYIRKGHAARIREWITGAHTRTWGAKISKIAQEVEKLLSPLPVRFRGYLGLVCESHHKNNLDKREVYPLYAPCGKKTDSAVNVQYAAILLRTVDLLHITQDRTPSVMLQTIELSDPKSVNEWDRQLGTFAVLPRKREFDPNDPQSTVIQISANFSEELPLFSLQEYITYANKQIIQSRRWANKSREDTDAKHYAFPWTSVKSDVRLQGVPPSPLKFELDRGRLLNLLVGHTIYNDATVAIRELLQNSIDAVRFQHHLDTRESQGKAQPPSAIGTVRVIWNSSSRKLIVEDNGTGMDREIIEEHLMMVGASYYNTPQFEAEHGEFSPISHFGIGVLTCFMVSDDIEIVTCRNGQGHRIRMTSVDTDYLLRELNPNDELLAGIVPHGTRVTLRLRETVDTEKRTIEDIVRYWVILPSCNVEFFEVGKEPQTIGFQSPEEALKYFHTRHSKQEEIDYIPTRLSLRGEKTKSDVEFLLKTSEDPEMSSENTSLSGKYELAFAVESNWSRERIFASQPGTGKDAPAVCIEGIRVSNSLPWFVERRGISALLAVRGDRQFRTTVSRSGLERDEEFDRVGKLCVDMLFQHIKDEIRSISNKKGKPLSQASSTSKWLHKKISTSFVRDEISVKYLEHSYINLPCMVIEELSGEISSELKTSRSLLSYVELSKKQNFWTIESRLLDSIGTISRDLGRELSLNEFLVALAPDYKELQFNPFLPDAHLFKEFITKSHYPRKALFSRQNRHAAIEWVRKDDNSGCMDLRLDKFIAINEELEELNARMHTIRRRSNESPFDSEIITEKSSFSIKIAEIEGDDHDIQILSTRTCFIVKKDSEFESIWNKLILATQHLNSSRTLNHEDFMKAVLAFLSIAYYLSLGSQAGRNGYYGGELVPIWRDGVEFLQRALDNLEEDLQLPSHPSKLIPERWIYNASSYWIDWLSY